MFKVAWKAPGGGSLNKTLKVIAARNKPRLMRMSAFARAPVALVIVDTCHVVASATWLDEMGGLGGIQADEMQLLRATLTTVAELVRNFQLICSTESKDVVRFCAEAGRFSVDDSRVFGNVFCATTAESHDYFDPAPFERAGRALTTTTFRTIDAGAAAQPQPRYFALRVHPCVVATKAQSAYDALHVVSATYTAFGDDVSATAVLGDLCDSAPYTDVADAYASAEVASAADTLSFLAAMCERGAETELANSLERAWGSKPPDVLQAALFSLATATSSATETVYMHITELVAAAWVE